MARFSARHHIERTPGVLETLGPRMDALAYNLKTGAMALYEWSTAHCILNGSAKFKQHGGT